MALDLFLNSYFSLSSSGHWRGIKDSFRFHDLVMVSLLPPRAAARIMKNGTYDAASIRHNRGILEYSVFLLALENRRLVVVLI